jgi:hypothetical protein
MKETKEFIKLKSLVAQIYGLKDVNYSTEVNKLKSLSEDNDRFIELFKSEFNVDMSTFPYYKFFEEDQFIVLNILRFFFRWAMKEKDSLTVGHLIKVIEKGKWFY